MEQPTDPKTRYNDDLRHAIYVGNVRGVQDALKRGADPNDTNTNPLSKAADYSESYVRQKMLGLLVTYGANVKRDQSILLTLARRGDETSIEMFLRGGADVNYGNGALLAYAALIPDIHMINMLIKYNVNFSLRLQGLMMAAMIHDSPKLAKILVDSKAMDNLPKEDDVWKNEIIRLAKRDESQHVYL
jgi:hypothetical protein